MLELDGSVARLDRLVTRGEILSGYDDEFVNLFHCSCVVELYIKCTKSFDRYYVLIQY